MCKDDEEGRFYQEKYYSFTLDSCLCVKMMREEGSTRKKYFSFTLGSCLCVKMMREEGSTRKNTFHLPWVVVYV